MKRTVFYPCFIFMLLVQFSQAFAQQKIFNRELSLGSGMIRSITQDKEGYMWLGSMAAPGGLYKYDGVKTQLYLHIPKDSNSLGNNLVRTLYTDTSGIIWIGTWGGGLDRFDASNEAFTHYRHNPDDPASISSDTVLCILEDHAGRLWIGTTDGLNLMDRTTGRFSRYIPKALVAGNVYQPIFIYEDRQQYLWIATWGNGLGLFNPETGKFTEYKHRMDDRNSISSDTVSTVFEDSEGNFWVGAIRNQLQSLNRKTGVFTHYPNYDPNHPGQISGPPPYLNYVSIIRFIDEDAAGRLWIGASFGGINKYDPSTKKTTHYGVYTKTALPGAAIISDSTSGLSVSFNEAIYSYFQSRDGLLWIGASPYLGNLYNVNPLKKPIPYHRINTSAVNSFYEDKNGAVWIGTQEGLVYKPLQGPEKKFVHDPRNPNSLSNNTINCIRADAAGNLWIATYGGGVNKLDPSTNTFTHYRYDKDNTKGYDNTSGLYVDGDNSLWVATDSCLNRININTGANRIYRHDPADSNSLGNSNVYMVTGKKNNVWIGTEKGLYKLDKTTGKWRRYLPNYLITSLHIDTANILWVGTSNGLFRYNRPDDTFSFYTDPGSGITVKGNVMNVIADNQNNLWISFAFRIYRINAARDNIRLYGSEFGVHDNQLLYTDNFKSEEGKLFLGDVQGYYSFYPEDINTHFTAPSFFISEFRMGNKDVKPGKGSPIQVEISKAKEVRLASNQNSFSLQFMALNYNHEEIIHYRYQLENYDSAWVDLGNQNKAYFFNVPPGHYTLRVRAVSNNGAWAEKIIAVFINLPWWQTWWGILLQAAGLIGLVSLVSYLRSRQLRQRNKLLEENVKHRTEELEKSYHNVEQLGEIGRKITSSLSVETIISTAYKNVNTLMDASVFGIGIYNLQTATIDFPATYENGKSLPFYTNSIHDKNRFGTICFNTGKEIIMGDLNEQYRDFIQQLPDPHEGEQTVSLMYLPLSINDKKLGVITVQSFKKNAYSDVHLSMLRNIANYTSIALENAGSYNKLNHSLSSLKETQTQLIHAEKMASLGELTAGIAHEIQNPLNFVNNFSEVNSELIAEMNQEIDSGNYEEVKSIANNISDNEQKIIFHGKRADAIVKGMLQHSRSNNGQKEPTDINALADEFLRLAYHGLRAKDKAFNATMKTDFDETIGNINIIPQDIGRMLLNLYNNAFYAVNKKRKVKNEKYDPTVTVATKKSNNQIQITVSDNGNGIPQHIIDKIFQPFFTTKPTGQGTGLGLSLAYDIVKAHGGELLVESHGKVETKVAEGNPGSFGKSAGTTFIIQLPA